jgi:superfamily II DNA/RNA helicase
MSRTLEDLINYEILDFLRTRHHVEKPHISVISPVPVNLWQPELCKKFRGDIEVEEDEDEGEDEDIFAYRYPGYIFGVDLLNAELGSGLVDTEFSFYVRTKYDYDDESKWDNSSYAHIRIGAAISSSDITYRITAGSVSQPESYSKEVARSKEGCVVTSFLVVPVECAKLAGIVNNLKQYEKQIFNRLAVTALPEGAAYKEEHTMLCIGADSATESEFVHIVPAGPRNYGLWNAIRAEVHDEQGNLVAYYYPSFGIIIGRCMQVERYAIKAYIVNLGGVVEPVGGHSLDKGELRRYCQRGVLYTHNPNEGGSRWALGLLLEVEGRLRATGGARLGIKWDAAHGGLMYAYTYNTMLIEEGPETYLLRDYALVDEELPAIRRSQLTVKEFFNRLVSKLAVDQRCKEAVAESLTYISEALRRMGIERLYTYQEEVIEEALASQGLIKKDGQVKRYIAVMARTAGGKTMSFLIPSVILSVYRRCREGRGVKAIFMYPTKALANDQLEEVAHLLYEINRVAQKGGKPYESPTFGVLHGNIKFREEHTDLPLPLPLRCPEHHSEVEFDGNHVVCRGDRQCRFAAFIERHMKFMRDDIFRDPPDILVTDEDMVNRILSGADRRSPRWFEWSIFGAGFKKCPSCGHAYPHIWSRKCINTKCKADLARVRPEKPSVPSLIVLDEAHMLTGSFGAQVHHMLSLLEYVLNGLAGPANNYLITYVLSSATMGKTEEFAASLLGASPGDIRVVKAELEEERETVRHKRMFTFIMPKSYTIDATAAMALWRLLMGLKRVTGTMPKGIVFTNYLDLSNELIHTLNNDEKIEQLKARIGGHSTDFDKDRVDVENKFKKGELDILVATSTLEVGVDYGVVDFVAIYGMPATVTSFIQRIGRAGRNRDAVVLVLFDPERRIDYYFFENYRLLSSGADRELALEREIYPVGRDNEVALRRAVRRYIVASLKLCCSIGCGNVNIQKLLCETEIGAHAPNINERIGLWKRVANAVRDTAQLPRSLSLHNNIITNELRESIDNIQRNASSITNIEDVVKVLGGGEMLYNLRAADEQVEFAYYLPAPYNRRRRDVRYAIKHALHGQITTYRGYFFAANGIEASGTKELKEFLKE